MREGISACGCAAALACILISAGAPAAVILSKQAKPETQVIEPRFHGFEIQRLKVTAGSLWERCQEESESSWLRRQARSGQATDQWGIRWHDRAVPRGLDSPLLSKRRPDPCPPLNPPAGGGSSFNNGGSSGSFIVAEPSGLPLFLLMLAVAPALLCRRPAAGGREL